MENYHLDPWIARLYQNVPLGGRRMVLRYARCGHRKSFYVTVAKFAQLNPDAVQLMQNTARQRLGFEALSFNSRFGGRYCRRE